jgi:hypothetical protein
LSDVYTIYEKVINEVGNEDRPQTNGDLFPGGWILLGW